MYALYNDQKPDPAVSFSYGHTKGLDDNVDLKLKL